MFNNAEAATILAGWKQRGRLADVEMYRIVAMRTAARERDAGRVAKTRAAINSRDARKRLEELEASRAKVRRTLGSPE